MRQAAEGAGFVGMSGMDHLIPPLAPEHPMYEAMTTNMWLAAHTSRLKVGSLVLCDAFRHPVMLAREAVAIDNASGGRFELGIGSGSVEDEFPIFGMGPESARDRTTRLGETLEVLRLLWSGESFSYEGQYFTITEGRQLPTPLDHIPIVVGGAGPRTMALVAEYADWWNCPLHRLDKLDEMRSRAGKARISTQQMVTFVADESQREAVLESATVPLRQDGRTLCRQRQRACRHLRRGRWRAGSSASTCGSPTSPIRARSKPSAPASSPSSPDRREPVTR